MGWHGFQHSVCGRCMACRAHIARPPVHACMQRYWTRLVGAICALGLHGMPCTHGKAAHPCMRAMAPPARGRPYWARREEAPSRPTPARRLSALCTCAHAPPGRPILVAEALGVALIRNVGRAVG
eukprot:366488-Chlamydomonas_euryale.AAC.2